MGERLNCARPEGESEIVVTGKREKCAVIVWESGRKALMLVRREVVRGSRAVLDEGTRIPRRIAFGGILYWDETKGENDHNKESTRT